MRAQLSGSHQLLRENARFRTSSSLSSPSAQASTTHTSLWFVSCDAVAIKSAINKKKKQSKYIISIKCIRSSKVYCTFYSIDSGFQKLSDVWLAACWLSA